MYKIIVSFALQKSLVLLNRTLALFRQTCAWQYFGTLIFELFFEIIRFYVDNINFLCLC